MRELLHSMFPVGYKWLIMLHTNVDVTARMSNHISKLNIDPITHACPKLCAITCTPLYQNIPGGASEGCYFIFTSLRHAGERQSFICGSL